MAKTPAAIESLNYEQALAELEKILSELENESHDLETSMQLFERGRLLIQRCQSLLDSAELKVRQLSASGELVDFEK